METTTSIPELGIFHVISAFCTTSVSQNEEITRKNSSSAYDMKHRSASGWSARHGTKYNIKGNNPLACQQPITGRRSYGRCARMNESDVIMRGRWTGGDNRENTTGQSSGKWHADSTLFDGDAAVVIRASLHPCISDIPYIVSHRPRKTFLDPCIITGTWLFLLWQYVVDNAWLTGSAK